MSVIAYDFRGHVISVGDTVVTVHSGPAGKLVIGKVLSISPKQCRIEFFLGVGTSRNFHTGESQKMGQISRRNHEHCVVLESKPE